MGKKIKSVIMEQMKDAKRIQDKYEYVDDAADDEHKYDESEQSQSFETETELSPKPLRIQITHSDGGTSAKRKKSKIKQLKEDTEEEKMKKMGNEESIDKLLKMELPEKVSQCLGSPTEYKLPQNSEEKENEPSFENLERDLRKLTHGLYNQSANQRKYSKLAILKWYQCLIAVYKKYRKLGGDSFWLTLNGFIWMLQDAKIPNKDTCTIEQCEQLFEITYKMHHRLQTRKASMHRVTLSAMYGDDNFNDEDPWTGAWIDKENGSE